MEYLLISLLFLLGTAFHVMQKIAVLKNKFSDLEFGTVWSTFFKEEWDSLIVSALVLGVVLITMYLINYNMVKLPDWVNDWGMYLISLILGYSGQRIAYKYLTTAEEALNKKVDGLKNIVN
jgi:ABC-type Fe3+ transport system permease subunit